MIQIFKIKNKQNNLNKENQFILNGYIEISKFSKDETLKKYNTSLKGLNNFEVGKLLEKNGYNVVLKEDKKSWFYFFLLAFKDKFIFLLLVLTIINFFLGDKLGSLIIFGIAFLSAFIRFGQDYSVYKFNCKLKAKISSKTILFRNNKEVEEKVRNVVIGDIVKLNAGSIIPADIRIIECKDLFINQSVFTGESIPIEKSIEYNDTKEIFSLSNICLMGSSVISGSATGVVINTGFDTYLGDMGKEIEDKKEVTNFDIGMEHITNMLIKYMVFVCLVVLLIEGIIKENYLEAILFALSVAVGITPSMLPMIVNVNLTRGSKVLLKKKTLVKKINAIQNLGAIDTLCTDKTGTLTENDIKLQKYIDVNGKENIDILEYAYLNSYYGTGIKNLVDRAIISYGKENNIDNKIVKYEKVDEIPFDYTRRRMSVVVKSDNDYRMITKGALEEILKVCTKVKDGKSIININNDITKIINNKVNELSNSGMQVIALAEKKINAKIYDLKFSKEDDMVFIGLVAFLDPPKKDVEKTLKKLKEIGIKTKILTGDNPYATKNICSVVGLNSDNIILGSDIDLMDDDKLSLVIEKTDVFARLNPIQKERVVKAYRNNGHVVSYMGDGVNDAPSLHAADVGISVDSAMDIAKEASHIILLEKNLDVIYDGVIEGRKVYGNIIKYMKMALSGDFGDVFSIMIASIFLPFLPLLPIQMLMQDFIYDFSQIGIPYDNVDDEFLSKPHKWSTNGISRFMNIMGITSSVIDVLSFIIFWYVLGYNSIDKQAYFQTAWFVTCLITELLIIHNVRTSKKPFIESNASKPLFILTIVSMALTIITPLALSSIKTFNFVILPLNYYFYLVILAVLYVELVNMIKKKYIKRYKEWL